MLAPFFELQSFAIELGKAANKCDEALGHINVDLYSLLANVPGVANRKINELEKIFRNNLKKYQNRLDDSQRLIRMTVAKMNEIEMLLAREAAELGRIHAGNYANLGMFNGNNGNSSGEKTDGKYLSKEEFNSLNNQLVEVDKVIDEHIEMGGDYHVYDNGLIVRKYLDMTGEKFITRYEIVDKIPNKDRTGGSKDLDSYFEGTPLAAVEYIGKPSTIAEKGVTKLVRKAAKEDYLVKVSKEIQERLAIRLRKQEPVLVGKNHPDVVRKSEKASAVITKGKSDTSSNGGVTKGYDVIPLKSTYQERLNQTPITNGKWSIERGESTFVSDKSEVKQYIEEAGVTGVEYKNAMPDFSPFSKEQVEITNMSVSRPSNFSKGDELLAKQWSTAEKQWTKAEVAKWRSQNMYTWHELNDGKTMQLVPTSINSKFGHLGGVSEVK